MPMEGCFKGVRTLIASYLLSEPLLQGEYVSAKKLRRNYLQRKRTKLGRLYEFNQTLNGLVFHGVLKASGEGNTLYTLNPDRSDFLALYLRKKVRVSPGCHRSMTLRAKLMALKNNIMEYETGSVSWVSWEYRPIVVVHTPKRVSPHSINCGYTWRGETRLGTLIRV